MMPQMTGYEFCKQARAIPDLKDVPIIVFSARFQEVDKQAALDAGATDYLPKSTASSALVARIEELLTDKTARPTVRGIIGLFSLRGGAGVTSIAVNLAVALALSQEVKVSLVDLALVGGHAALMLGRRPTSSVPQLLASAGGDYSLNQMAPHFIPHDTGVQLLASAPTFGQQFSLADDRLQPMFRGLKSGFPLTVLDVPHLLESHFSPALQLVDKLVLVQTPDMPSVQSTAIALQGLRQLGMADQKIALLVNHVSPDNPLPVETIQKAVKRPIAASIPFEPEMTKAVNSGRPLVLNSPKSAGAVAIDQLTTKLFT
jgi:pilus assembly protein CpaE